MSRVLVVEDEVTIAELISLNLRHSGFEVVVAHSADHAQTEIGPGACQTWFCWTGCCQANQGWPWPAAGAARRARDCTIIMLTARAEEVDKVAGLDAGADDYLTKAFLHA